MKNNDDFDEKFMRRCIVLAKRGIGFVSPNPLVGCVLVQNKKIVAEGYYKKFGGAHAEIDALHKVKHATGVTAYVTLEPHNHLGKTAPCTEALIAAGVKKVVIGMIDPNPQVSGSGIKKLRSAGIEVVVGVLQKECEALNEVFIKYIQTKRPFVVVKSAVTLDGALALKKRVRSNFSSPESYMRVHDLRLEYDAIGLGVNSVLTDNPLLTCRRKGRKRNPVRVIFDTHLRIMEDVKMFGEEGKTVIFTGPKINEQKKKKIVGKYPMVEIVGVGLDRGGHVSLRESLEWLGEHGIASLQVEGGGEIVTSLLRDSLVDKLMLVVTPRMAQSSDAPKLFLDVFPDLKFKNIKWEFLGGDAWFVSKIM